MSKIPNIPEDIISEILFRLPAKPLVKFRCVSKTWLSLLTNPIFIKKHLNKNTNAKKILTLFPSDFPSYTLHTLTRTSHGVFESRKLDFPPHIDQTWLTIVGSSNGLVLCLNNTYENNMFLLNPTTSKYIEIPKSPLDLNEHEELMHGFGYDEYSDDYKVVTLNNYFGTIDIFVDVYSFKRNCWKRLETSRYHFHGLRVSGVLLHGYVHWVGYTLSNNSLDMIIAFDLNIEEFSEIALPHPDEYANNNVGRHLNLGYDLVILEGCLCVFIEHESFGIDLWMMKEYGVQSSWIKITRLSMLEADMYGHVQVVGDQELIVSNNDDDDYGNLEIYNVKEDRFTMFVVDGAPATSRKVWIFVESLVSPLIN